MKMKSILKKDKVISMSICDTTAIAPIVKKIDQKFKILNGHITTLHPWLNYQNFWQPCIS